MGVAVTTGVIRRAKLQSKCHHQQTNTDFLRPEQNSSLPILYFFQRKTLAYFVFFTFLKKQNRLFAPAYLYR